MLTTAARALAERSHATGFAPCADTVEARITRTKLAGWAGPWRFDGRPITQRAQLKVYRQVACSRLGALGWDQLSVRADLDTLEARLAGPLPGEGFHISVPGELPVPTQEKAA